MKRKEIYNQFIEEFEFIYEWFWENQVDENAALFGTVTMSKFDYLKNQKDFKRRFFIELIRQKAIEPYQMKNGRRRWLTFRFYYWKWNVFEMKMFLKLKDTRQFYLFEFWKN